MHLRNPQICQRQTLSKVDDRGTVELGDNERDELLRAQECGDSNSHGKEGEDVTPAVKEEPTLVGSINQMGPKATERL